MKMQIEVPGAQRREKRGGAVLGMDGIVPQDAFCEDVCHQVYPGGSEELEQCLDDCRDN